jgi:hypothetical protein
MRRTPSSDANSASKTRAAEVADELRLVESQIRVHQSGGPVDYVSLNRLLAKRKRSPTIRRA